MADVGTFKTLIQEDEVEYTDGPIRVLYVDGPGEVDDASDRLERANSVLSVVTETSVSAALDRLRSASVDCIVSDYDLPDSDGLSLLHAVRDVRPDLPVVLFTEDGSEDVASRAISAGVTDYFRKDEDGGLPVLANRVENLVSQYHAERQVKRGFSAMDTAREGISILDENGHFIYANQRYAELLGYEPSELVGKHWSALYPDEAIDYIENEVLPAVPVKGRWTGETVYVRQDGERILVDHALAYTDEDDLICLIKDQDDTERPLVADTTFVQHTLDALDDIFYVVDTDFNVLRVNDQATDVTGYSETELTSMDPLRLFPPEEQQRVEAKGNEALETGSSALEVDLVTRDGERIPYEFKNQRLTNADDTVIGFVGIGRDVSHRTRVETELEETSCARQRFYDIVADDAPFEEQLERALEVGRDRLGLGLGFLTRIAEGTQHVETALGDHPELQDGASCPLSEAYCRRTIEADDLLSVQDAAVEGWEDDPAFERFGLGSYIGAKVVVDGDLYGTLCFADTNPRTESFTDAERSFVELLARWAGYRIARNRDQERFDAIADLADDATPLIDQLDTHLDAAREDSESEHLDAATETNADLADVTEEIAEIARKSDSYPSAGPQSRTVPPCK